LLPTQTRTWHWPKQVSTTGLPHSSVRIAVEARRDLVGSVRPLPGRRADRPPPCRRVAERLADRATPVRTRRSPDNESRPSEVGRDRAGLAF
jgi:hypothetical protein